MDELELFESALAPMAPSLPAKRATKTPNRISQALELFEIMEGRATNPLKGAPVFVGLPQNQPANTVNGEQAAQLMRDEDPRNAQMRRAVAASQLMQHLSGLNKEVRQGLLPKDLRPSAGTGKGSIPPELYAAMGTEEFEPLFNQAVKGMKRTDAIALMQQHQKKLKANANPAQVKLDNTVKFLEENGIRLNPAQKALLAKKAAGLSDVEQSMLESAKTTEASADPLGNLQKNWGLKLD